MWPAAAPPTRPAAGLLPAAAGHRAAVDIIGDDVSGRGGLHVFCRRGCLTTMGSVTIGSLIPYQIVKQCVCTLSIGIGAIWDIETFDDSRLTAKFCVLPVRRSVQGAHYRALVRAGASVLRQRRQESGQLRHLHRQAGTEALLGFNGSSTSAEPPQKSLMIMKKGMRDRVG